MRHHRPVQAELLYYPQATTLTNGPTYVIPYSVSCPAMRWLRSCSEVPLKLAPALTDLVLYIH